MIKLIASDLDGTLIPEGQTQLSGDIFEIVPELKKHGITFVSASGRQLDSQQLLWKQIANSISYISENGAICFHDNNQYVITEFDHDVAMRIIEEVEKRPNCKLTVSCPTTQYIKSGDEKFLNHMRNYLKYHTTPIDSFQEIKEPIVKIAFLDTITTEESLEYFKDLFGKELKVVTAGNLWIDFIPLDSSKAKALKFLMNKLEIKPSEAISFGDQQNDVEMLEYTEKSYAMAHAKLDVQAHATNITESVEKTLRELLKTLQ